jgi:hypothetical protein
VVVVVATQPHETDTAPTEVSTNRCGGVLLNSLSPITTQSDLSPIPENNKTQESKDNDATVGTFDTITGAAEKNRPHDTRPRW